MALWNRVECRSYNETNIPPCQFKNATKINIILNFVLCPVILILFNTNLITKNNISCVKNVLKTLKSPQTLWNRDTNLKNILASLYIQNPGIFKTWGTLRNLAYAEQWYNRYLRHIQNFGVFRTLSNIYDGAFWKNS